MANTLEYAKIFTQKLDELMLPMLTSAPMEVNSSVVKYNGGDEIKIPKILMTGLGDYSRDTGFPDGSVTLSYETHKLTMDRGMSFKLDAMDVDETNFVATAGNVMGEFQRTKVAPEIDAYRYSKIYSIASAASKTTSYSVDDDDIFEQLSEDISKVQDIVGEGEAMTIYMSYAAARSLDLADKIEKKLDVTSMDNGSVKNKVRSLDGIPIIRVPSVRFKSAYTFGSDGFTAGAGALDINWIIAVNRATLAITKQDKTRIFAPDVNQDADAWLLQYRRYHDLFVPDNKVDGLWVSYTPAL